MLHDWYWLVVVALAVFRATGLITADTILDRPRDWVVARGGKLAELVACPWCVSMWFGAAAAWLSYEDYVVWRWVAFALALSAVTGLLSFWTER